MVIHFDKKEIGFDEALDRYPENEFDSPTCSTIPLLDLIKNGEDLLRVIVYELGIEGESTYHLEYTVKPPEGRGNSSHTDLFVKTNDKVLGIEAKWTERRYMSVGKWRQKGSNPDNRKVVLEGWLDRIRFLPPSIVIDKDNIHNQVYQMVHRAASVCPDSQKTKTEPDPQKPILAYLQFTEEFQPKEDSYIYKDMSSLWSVLGYPENFPFYYVQVLIEPNPAFRQIENLKKGSVETGKKVKEALKGNEPLFTYREMRIVKIGEE